jgi:predicted AAA+ superfamily ATPase
MIRQTPKKQFVDPSIAVLALSATANDLEKDMETFGFFFESLVTRDLRIYVENIGGHVYFYRDRNNLEVDCILKLDDGRWAAVEVKIGSNKIEEAAQSLLALRDNVDTRHMNEPSFMMIVYGGTYAYQRADGIYVVPIGCLKP